MKPELAKKNPAITLPYLLDGDKVITESDAICVYLCHKANRLDLLGRNADEQVTLYTALGVLKDMHPNYVRHVYGTYGQGSFEEALKTHRGFIQAMKPYTRKLNGILGDKKFIAGDELVWLDFALAEFFQVLNVFEPLVLEDYPNLKAYQTRVWELPELKNYFSSERYSERPCNNIVAKWK